ncbi:hypothetical protein AL522_10705 [Pantoea vagans]|nr:hypothetical protein AL522_10705 [Pantoea vagans]
MIHPLFLSEPWTGFYAFFHYFTSQFDRNQRFLICIWPFRADNGEQNKPGASRAGSDNDGNHGGDGLGKRFSA